MKNSRKYSLITGASQGLGKALAEECAQKGMNLILVSLAHEGIHDLAEDIKAKYKVDVVGLEADLTNDEELQHLSQHILKNYTVNMLINNAGMGGTKTFLEASNTYIDNILLLNIRALVVLTKNLLPQLKEQSKAFILNIASLASFGPMPFKTVYPASKAFVYSFSRGLSAELEDSNVVVSVAHPGGMATNKDVSKRIDNYSAFVKATILSPEEVAAICIRKLLHKKQLIIPGLSGKLSWVFFKFFPSGIRLKIFRRAMLKEVKVSKEVYYV